MILAIADIAGQYNALMRLVARVPEDTKIILLGDLCDRGPDSHKVIQWAIDNQHRVRAVLGNHEHMMLDYFEAGGIYGHGIWMGNGGDATYAGYEKWQNGNPRPPQAHFDWLKSNPLYIVEEGALFSHAPLNAEVDFSKETLEEVAEETRKYPDVGSWMELRGSLLWNRREPKSRPEFFQIFGHNSHWGLTAKEGWVCLDQSKLGVLTGLLWEGPDKNPEVLEEFYEEPGEQPYMVLEEV